MLKLKAGEKLSTKPFIQTVAKTDHTSSTMSTNPIMQNEPSTPQKSKSSTSPKASGELSATSKKSQSLISSIPIKKSSTLANRSVSPTPFAKLGIHEFAKHNLDSKIANWSKQLEKKGTILSAETKANMPPVLPERKMNTYSKIHANTVSKKINQVPKDSKTAPSTVTSNPTVKKSSKKPRVTDIFASLPVTHAEKEAHKSGTPKPEPVEEYKKQINDLKQKVKQYELDKRSLEARVRDLADHKDHFDEDDPFGEEQHSSSASGSWTPTESYASEFTDVDSETAGEAEVVYYVDTNGKLISASAAYESLHKRFRETLLSFSGTVEILKKNLVETQQKGLAQSKLLRKYEEAMGLLKSEYTKTKEGSEEKIKNLETRLKEAESSNESLKLELQQLRSQQM